MFFTTKVPKLSGMGAAHEGKHPLIGLGKNDERNFALIYLKKRKKYSLVSDVNQSNTLFTTRYNNKVPVFCFVFSSILLHRLFLFYFPIVPTYFYVMTSSPKGQVIWKTK